MRLCLALLIFLSAGFAQAKFIYYKDWTPHKFCDKDSRLNKNYCLELIEIPNDSPHAVPLLLIPGFFQNAYIFDLIPSQGISLARHLKEKWNFTPYILHVRGNGNSDYIERSDLDDIAIDDIGMALNYLHKKYRQKITIIGHSQGAITAQTFAAGLSHCLIAPCFNPLTALERQRKIKSIGLLAGNAAMTIHDPKNFLLDLSKVALKAAPALLRFDEIDVKTATRYTWPLGHVGPWKLLFNPHNVGRKARTALWTKTIDTTTSRIIYQFVKGIDGSILRTRSRIPYVSAFSLIRVPIYQQTYADDPMAQPQSTYSDSFEKIGSKSKRFEVVQDRGHEDVLLNGELHSDLDAMAKFLQTPY